MAAVMGIVIGALGARQGLCTSTVVLAVVTRARLAFEKGSDVAVGGDG
jgi:hypothetical protein